MSPFQSLREYELFVYSLPDQFPRIVRSTLVVAQRGRYYAELAGEVLFPTTSIFRPTLNTIVSLHLA